jgi:YVTN family beta-propeller protein
MKRAALFALASGIALTLLSFAQQPAATPPAAGKKQPPPPPPGVLTPGVRRAMSAIQPQAVFNVEGAPDWQVVTEDAVWVTSAPKSTVSRLDVNTNTVAATIPVGRRPCSGLTAGFGTIWVPNCGDKTLSRIDVKTNQVIATLPFGPAQSEGLVAASPEAFWMVSGKGEKLLRIDPKTNQVAAEIEVADGSASAIFADDAIWVTSPEKGIVTRVDAKTSKVTDTIPVGLKPRFETAGGGSVWVLNQGNGTVSRIDQRSRKVIATIEAGLPGEGGEMAFGNNHVWVTMLQAPITEIDPATNAVVRQWFGSGGDSIRVAFGSIWLCNLRQQTVWRIDIASLK